MTSQFVVKTQAGKLTIEKRQVKLTSATDTKVYDGKPLANDEVTVSGDGWATGEGATYTVTGSQTLPGGSPNSFEYTLDAGTKADNYNITKEVGQLTVTARPDEAKFEITVVANSGTEKYDGTEKGVSGLVQTEFEFDGVKYAVEGLSAEAKGTDAGEYTANVTGTAVVRDADNNDVTSQFVVKTQAGKLVIGQREVVVAAKDSSKTFGASDPAFTATVTGEVVGEEGIIEYTVSRPGAGVDEAVDTYVDAIVVAGDADQGNYTVSYEPADFTITQQSITPGPDPDNPDPSYQGIKVSQPADQVYNGNYQQPEIVVTDSEGNTLDASIDGGATGDYVITYGNNVNATSEGNLATAIVKGINNYSGEVVQTFQIAPAKATVLVNDSAKVYGEDDPVGYNGYSVVLEGTDQPLYTNVETKVQDTLGDITVVRPGMGTDENAVVYEDALDVSVANQNANYTYTVDKGNFTISAAGGNVVTLASQAEGNTKTYDGQSISIDASASKPGSTLWYSTDGENWTETKPSLTNVGTLTIYVKATNPNYEDSAVVSATVQVTPATLRVTTDSLGKVFDGTALTAEGEVSGFVNNETATFAVTGSQTEVGSSVNDYSLVFDQTAKQSNYTVVESLGILTVWPQSIDPTDPGENPDPDDPDAPDPTDPDPGYDPDDPDPEDPDQPFYTGIKVQGPDPQMYDAADQTPGVVVTDKNGKVLEEGTDYRITGYDNNYNVTTEDSLAIIHVEGIGNYRGNVDVEFEITPAPLTVTTPSAGKVYDGSALTAGPADVEGLQGSDATAVTITANGTQTDVGNSVNGVSYDWGQVLASNYSITEDLGTLTVWPQSIDPTDPGENPDPDDPDAPDPSDPDPDFPGEDPDPDNPVVPDQPFYTGAEVDYPQDVSYNGTDQTWVPTVTDAEGNLLTEGEDYEVSYSTDDRTNATGDITVTITGKGNYAGTITREYQITPLEIDVYIENQTKVEGEADPTFTFNYEGVLEGESMGWTGAFVRDAGEAAGTYNVAQGGFVLADNEAGNFLASNYTLTVHPGTLTITAAPVPPGPDDPDTPVTPVTPLPTPDPTPTLGTTTPVPTPGPGDAGATPTPTDEAEEAIDDEATPLTAPEPIDDDATPLAANEHRDCWVHWLMLLGILVTVVYYGGVGVRRVRFSSSLQSFEDDVLGNDETNR